MCACITQAQYGEAKAKEMKMKQAAMSKVKPEADINPNLIEVAERVPVKEEKIKDPIPDIEWWCVIVLPPCHNLFACSHFVCRIMLYTICSSSVLIFILHSFL